MTLKRFNVLFNKKNKFTMLPNDYKAIERHDKKIIIWQVDKEQYEWCFEIPYNNKNKKLVLETYNFKIK